MMRISLLSAPGPGHRHLFPFDSKGGTVHIIGTHRRLQPIYARAAVIVAVVAATLVALVGTAHAIAWGGPTM